MHGSSCGRPELPASASVAQNVCAPRFGVVRGSVASNIEGSVCGCTHWTDCVAASVIIAAAASADFGIVSGCATTVDVAAVTAPRPDVDVCAWLPVCCSPGFRTASSRGRSLGERRGASSVLAFGPTLLNLLGAPEGAEAEAEVGHPSKTNEDAEPEGHLTSSFTFDDT